MSTRGLLFAIFGSIFAAPACFGGDGLPPTSPVAEEPPNIEREPGSPPTRPMGSRATAQPAAPAAPPPMRPMAAPRDDGSGGVPDAPPDEPGVAAGVEAPAIVTQDEPAVGDPALTVVNGTPSEITIVFTGATLQTLTVPAGSTVRATLAAGTTSYTVTSAVNSPSSANTAGAFTFAKDHAYSWTWGSPVK